jgi:HEAT repeat protein
MPGMPGGGPNTPGLRPNSPLSPTTRAALAEKSEPTAWQIWWAFNQGRYLEFGKYVNSLGTVTFLGRGSDGAPKSTEEMVQAKLQPALLKAIGIGGDVDLVNALLVSLAKLGDPENEVQAARFEFTLDFLLKNEIDSIAETAAVAHGILGSEGSTEILIEVLADSEKGRELLETEEIGFRTRAFAAYALGLIGQNSKRPDLKQKVVQSLVEALEVEEDEDDATSDVKVASIIALGLVRLDRDEDCDCKGYDHEPWTSRQALMWYLLEYFCKPRENPWLLRAHCATAMAKQLENVDSDDYKEYVVDALVDALKQSSREQLAVRQSCIIGLGIIGDADDDTIDKKIRTTLTRMCGHAEEQCRRFALIAMGQVGGRPGDDPEDPLGAAPEIRKFLLKRFGSGTKGLRPWAGLSLGIMGHDLMKAGEIPSEDVTIALRSKLSAARKPEDFGAYAIALGMRGDTDACKTILKKMRKWRGDDDCTGNALLALGMVGNRDATEKVRELLMDSLERPTVHRQAAMALAMLGDSGLTEDLLEGMMDVECTKAERTVYATAISYVADTRHIDRLIKLLGSEALDDTFRGFVTMALGQIADRELEPWNSCISCDVNYLAGVETLTNCEGTGIMDRR